MSHIVKSTKVIDIKLGL